MKTPAPRNFYTTHKDRQFYVNQVLDWPRLGSVREGVDKETYQSVLEGAGEIIGEQIAPRAPKTERQDYRIEDGNVVWPEDVQRSYDDLKNGGLLCSNIEEKYGGLGLPFTVTSIMSEMLFQADPGFGTIPLLGSGVAEMIEAFGSDQLKRDYLTRMTTGEFTGSMDLTEPNAGSDLGQVMTKATEADSKTYITGAKTFITNGGADVHLVLARDADVYKETLGKTKGISLYLVPRTDKVKVTKLEEKMGIHSSPTCGLTYDEAEGYLVGEKGKGLKYMLHLMNNARLGVAAQGLGTLEASLFDAKAYAEERSQFGKSISKHSLVRDMLTEMQDYSEVMRALIYPAAFATDMGDNAWYKNQAAVLTPVAKFFATEKAIELTRTGIQVHGGVGFTKEFNAEKYLRDAVITSIYEGTSEIQVSLFLNDVLGSLRNPVKARANPLILLDELDANVGSDSQAARRVKQGSKQLRRSINSLGIYLTQTSNAENKYGDTDEALSHSKRLAYMMAEVYGAYQLVKQGDEKREISDRFTRNMEPRIEMYAKQIENGLDARQNKKSVLIRRAGSNPKIFSAVKRFGK